MRKYLAEIERVFINNIIVTLPSDTKIKKDNDENETEGGKPRKVIIEIPNAFNSVGVVDGQHRVFSYHEGNDIYEIAIKKLRQRQNLLLTGIIYPGNIPDTEKRKFEARLFLEINDKQSRARSDLKQAIELIVNPYSTLAISKAIISRLSKDGPLAAHLEEHFFDVGKVKTSSIVSYGLQPLVKLKGGDTLMKLWEHPNKDKLINAKNDSLLEEYVAYCTNEVKKIVVGFKMNIPDERWVVDKNKGSNSVLTPTIINGLINCLRILVTESRTMEITSYKQKFYGVDKFRFSSYKSSQWKALGEALYKKYFKIN